MRDLGKGAVAFFAFLFTERLNPISEPGTGKLSLRLRDTNMADSNRCQAMGHVDENRQYKEVHQGQAYFKFKLYYEY